jgi:hypothetical protein
MLRNLGAMSLIATVYALQKVLDHLAPVVPALLADADEGVGGGVKKRPLPLNA